MVQYSEQYISHIFELMGKFEDRYQKLMLNDALSVLETLTAFAPEEFQPWLQAEFKKISHEKEVVWEELNKRETSTMLRDTKYVSHMKDKVFDFYRNIIFAFQAAGVFQREVTMLREVTPWI
ncbi:MAG: hypothetical protein QXU75_09090 [Candidatus Methanomethylicaceae archaeon]